MCAAPRHANSIPAHAPCASCRASSACGRAAGARRAGAASCARARRGRRRARATGACGASPPSSRASPRAQSRSREAPVVRGEEEEDEDNEDDDDDDDSSIRQSSCQGKIPSPSSTHQPLPVACQEIYTSPRSRLERIGRTSATASHHHLASLRFIRREDGARTRGREEEDGAGRMVVRSY